MMQVNSSPSNGVLSQRLPTTSENDGLAAADSLRAAALRTRHAKRRLASDSANEQDSDQFERHPVKRSRARLPSSLQLDYGSGLHNDSLDDKEEGEISDDELLQLASGSQLRHPVNLSIETEVRHPDERSHTLQAPESSMSMASKAEFARPNLHMTDEQLWEAKDIILDLLGWGVPSSYLMDCGLTREAVFYVFTELSLKLPDGFKTEDMKPFAISLPALSNGKGERTQAELNQPPHRYNDPDVPSPVVMSQRQQPTAASMDHPLPPKPSTSHPALAISDGPRNPASNLPTPQLSYHTFENQSNGAVVEPSAQDHTIGSPSLATLEIENRRRLQLLARKAAMASRKTRTGSGMQSPHPEQLESSNANASNQVDDFLNSIAPALEVDASRDVAVPAVLEWQPAQIMPKSRSISPVSDSSLASAALRKVPGGLGREADSQVPTLARRASKRPVASDFVDLATSHTTTIFKVISSSDTVRSHSTRSTSASTATTPTDGRPSWHRLTFTNVGITKRCVIDFSDDEDETVEEKAAAIQRLKEEIEKRRLKGQKVLSSSLLVAIHSGSHAKINGSGTLTPVRQSQSAPDVTPRTNHDRSFGGRSTPSRVDEDTVEKILSDPVQAMAPHELNGDGLTTSDDSVSTQSPSPPDEDVEMNHGGAVETVPDSSASEDVQSGYSVEAQPKEHGYRPYSSLFDSYSRLRVTTLSLSGDSPLNSIELGTDAPTRAATDGVRTADDPNGMICRYEVPGGGECKDDQCMDVHVRQKR